MLYLAAHKAETRACGSSGQPSISLIGPYPLMVNDMHVYHRYDSYGRLNGTNDARSQIL